MDLSKVIGYAATSIAVGLWGSALGASDMITATILLISGLLVIVLAISAEQKLNRNQKTFCILVSVLVTVITISYIYYRDRKHIPDSLLSAQIDEMKNLDAFLRSDPDGMGVEGDASETSLRRLFDYVRMVQYNTLLFRREAEPNTLTKEQIENIDSFKSHGVALIDTSAVDITPLKNQTFNIKPNNVVYYVYMSNRHVVNRSELVKFANSIEIPAAIRAAIQNLIADIDVNDTLLIKIIREKSNFLECILGDQDRSSQFYGCVSDTYWARFTSLKKSQEKIRNLIHNYLENL